MEHVAGLIDVELIRVQSVITVALVESEGTVSEVICDVRDVSLPRHLLILRVRLRVAHLIILRSCSLCDLSSLRSLYRCC